MSSISGTLLLLVGPSGVGKGTTITLLRQRHPDWVFPVSVTTRKPRPSEKNGEIYYFFSDEEFEREKNSGAFLEWACVHKTHYYGTLKSEILPHLQEGKIVFREVDAQGFCSITQHPDIPRENIIAIFLLPPPRKELVQRIRTRAPISDEELEQRLESIENEMKVADKCDYQVQTEEGKLQFPADEIDRIVQKTR